jgi:hypothetical protein
MNLPILDGYASAEREMNLRSAVTVSGLNA